MPNDRLLQLNQLVPARLTQSELLDYQMVVPTCNSGYFNGREKLESPEQLLDENLLHLDTAYDPGSKVHAMDKRRA